MVLLLAVFVAVTTLVFYDGDDVIANSSGSASNLVVPVSESVQIINTSDPKEKTERETKVSSTSAPGVPSVTEKK